MTEESRVFEGRLTVDRLAAALPDVMSEGVCREVMGEGVDRLDCEEEWYMSPRQLAAAILANLSAEVAP